jgi:hypothetical protein
MREPAKRRIDAKAEVLAALKRSNRPGPHPRRIRYVSPAT